MWTDKNGIVRSDIHRPGRRSAGSDQRDLELAFHAGEARLVKRAGEKTRLEYNSTRRWVGAVKPDQGREP